MPEFEFTESNSMPKTNQTGLKLRYRPGASDIGDLQAEVSSALEELGVPNSELARAASSIGVTADEFAGATGSVEQQGKGFGEVVVIIAIFAPAINHALRNVWDEAIWPRVKSRLGADAVGKEIEKGDGDQDDDDGDQDDSER